MIPREHVSSSCSTPHDVRETSSVLHLNMTPPTHHLHHSVPPDLHQSSSSSAPHGKQKFTHHALRHTGATRWLRSSGLADPNWRFLSSRRGTGSVPSTGEEHSRSLQSSGEENSGQRNILAVVQRIILLEPLGSKRTIKVPSRPCVVLDSRFRSFFPEGSGSHCCPQRTGC